MKEDDLNFIEDSKNIEGGTEKFSLSCKTYTDTGFAYSGEAGHSPQVTNPIFYRHFSVNG